MKISQYSIKQATIEQIFNMFAAGQIAVKAHFFHLKILFLKVNQEEIDQNLLRKSSSLALDDNQKVIYLFFLSLYICF